MFLAPNLITLTNVLRIQWVNRGRFVMYKVDRLPLSEIIFGTSQIFQIGSKITRKSHRKLSFDNFQIIIES